MKKNSLILLIIVFLLLSIFAAYPFYKPFFTERFGLKDKKGLDFSVCISEDTDRISISRKTEKTNLVKKENIWQADGYKIDQNKLDSLFDFFRAIKEVNVVSRNEENRKSYGVSKEESILVACSLKGEESAFLIGRQEGLNSFYAGKKDSPDTYIVDGDASSILSSRLSFWRDKEVFRTSKENLSKIEAKGQYNFILEKDSESDWQLTQMGESKKLTGDEKDRIFSAFDPLIADDFLDMEEANMFDSEPKTVMRFYEGDDKVLFEFSLAEKSGEYWLKVSNKEDIYSIYKYRLQPLFDLVEE